jgi:hypothetical protein
MDLTLLTGFSGEEAHADALALNFQRILTKLTPLTDLMEEPGIGAQLRRLIGNVNRPG